MATGIDTAFGYLQTAASGGRLAHAYLITGPSGSGKAQLAARLVALINEGEVAADMTAIASDTVRVVQPESKSRRIKVEQIRDLEGMLHQRATGGRHKVGIVVDADRMGEAAENAFLKTLEEPPDGCLLLLLTAFPEQLLDTILSRCILISLRSVDEHLDGGESGVALRAMLTKAGVGGGTSEALAMAKAFSDLLKTVKGGAEKSSDDAQKSEREAYGKTTDGRWLKDRENFHKASSASMYLGQRAELLEILVAWFGDALRQQNGYGRLDLPHDAAATAALSQALSTTQLAKRMEAVERLRDDLATNVQESLAIEVAFIEAFASA